MLQCHTSTCRIRDGCSSSRPSPFEVCNEWGSNWWCSSIVPYSLSCSPDPTLWKNSKPSSYQPNMHRIFYRILAKSLLEQTNLLLSFVYLGLAHGNIYLVPPMSCLFLPNFNEHGGHPFNKTRRPFTPLLPTAASIARENNHSPASSFLKCINQIFYGRIFKATTLDAKLSTELEDATIFEVASGSRNNYIVFWYQRSGLNLSEIKARALRTADDKPLFRNGCWEPSLNPHTLRKFTTDSIEKLGSSSSRVSQSKSLHSTAKPRAGSSTSKGRSRTSLRQEPITRKIPHTELEETIEATVIPIAGSKENSIAIWLNKIISAFTHLPSPHSQSHSQSRPELEEPRLTRSMSKTIDTPSTQNNLHLWSSQYATKPVENSPMSFKPDIVFCGQLDPHTGFVWRNVISFFELTSSNHSTQLRRDITRKVYAVFMSQPNRRFVVALSLARQEFRLHVFDRSGVIHSLGSNVHKDYWTHKGRKHTEEEILLKIKGLLGVPQLVKAWTVQIENVDETTDCLRPPISGGKTGIRDSSSPTSLNDANRRTYLPILLIARTLHFILVDVYGILHHDISLNNVLMFICAARWPVAQQNMQEREDVIASKKFQCGLLIDFDYAEIINEVKQGVSSGDRTGTIPFMAIDLLQQYTSPSINFTHTFLHDLESLIYVLVWICILYQALNEIRSDQGIEQTCLKQWALVKTVHEIQALCDQKLGQLLSRSILNDFALYFEPLKPFVTQLYKLIQCSQDPEDDAILTHTAVIEILMGAFKLVTDVPCGAANAKLTWKRLQNEPVPTQSTYYSEGRNVRCRVGDHN
ncbi:hypothetical protein JVT61DRAFT_7875 [Boletus reticuloceps]|uniref:Fungal-type protein kinase domain-containing protein n=1 Tax=Boletus reticuloceps TaxID=495285 RepID=A0A8I2YIH8_9AGAM|nr:hypothetical protein JVT61DRAFT_7875 [Boletus reticuloceps]